VAQDWVDSFAFAVAVSTIVMLIYLSDKYEGEQNREDDDEDDPNKLDWK
jgi:hypothetical protein